MFQLLKWELAYSIGLGRIHSLNGRRDSAVISPGHRPGWCPAVCVFQGLGPVSVLPTQHLCHTHR